MWDFRRITAVVLVVGISVFLIYSSCHDNHGIDDPDRGGGIGGLTAMVQQPEARPEITSTSTTRPTPEPTGTPGRVRVRQPTSTSEEVASRNDYPAFEWHGFNSTSGSVDSATQRPSVLFGTSKRETDKIQGTWILVDSNNMILELTITNNDDGSLKSYRSETEKNISVERKVRVVADGNSIWVVASDSDTSISRLMGSEMIMLAFSFDPPGAPSVVKLNSRNNELAQLKVVSHTR